MFFKLKKSTRAMYTCPFCKTEIVASKKTEIFYRSGWLNGCNDCFALSINALTTKAFQTADY